MDGSTEQTLGDLISELKKSTTSKPQKAHEESKTFDSKAERARKDKIRNDNLESDQKMKKWSLVALFIFLGIETIAVFFIVFFQGFKTSGFQIEEWNFRLVIGGTLIQITAMLEVAIKHLFPPASSHK